MVFIDKPVNLNSIWNDRETTYTELHKFAIDVENEWVVIDGEMQADCETVLLEQGSQQQNIWGGNVYPENRDADFLEFTSFINIRPSQDNPSINLLNTELRDKVTRMINKLLL